MRALQIRGKEHSCSGPLVPYVEEFSALFAREGYAPATVHAKVQLLIDLSSWLERRTRQVAQLDEEQIRQFMLGRRRRGTARRGDTATGRQLLGYLRGLGCTPAPCATEDDSPLGRIVRDFERFLSAERGLTRATLINYVPTVRRFLRKRFGVETPRFNELALIDIHRFIINEAQRVSRRRAQLSVTAMRSFLRFLQQRGAITADLVDSVKQHGRLNDIHLGRLDGDGCRGLMGHGNGSCGWLSSEMPSTAPGEQRFSDALEKSTAYEARSASIGKYSWG